MAVTAPVGSWQATSPPPGLRWMGLYVVIGDHRLRRWFLLSA
jgi:hypothetical protein